MKYLGHINDNKDLVNKEYVDNAIPYVPINVSELTNDVGYITVHQDISALQTQAITDIGLYFAVDTVEDALQELGASKTTIIIKRW